MTLKLRSEKGSALTYNEMDANFQYALSEYENGNWTITVENDDLKFKYANTSIISLDANTGFAIASTSAETINVTNIFDLNGGNSASINGITPAIATQAEAEAGSDNTKIMTALRVAQEIGVPNAAPVKSALNASGNPPIYACRAWVYFNGATAVISGSGNVQSVTRNAAGLYTITFATAMPDTNYAVVGQSGLQVNNYMTSVMTVARTTTTVQVDVKSTNHARYDAPDMSVAIFR